MIEARMMTQSPACSSLKRGASKPSTNQTPYTKCVAIIPNATRIVKRISLLTMAADTKAATRYSISPIR